MPDETTFTGTRGELLRTLAGEDVARIFDEEVSLSVLEFLDAHGASIQPAEDQSDSLEVRLVGPVFLSVQRFVWGSAAAILGLAVAIYSSSPTEIASAAQVAVGLLSSISIFPPDTTEFKVYSAIAALQKKNPASSPSTNEIHSWLSDQGEIISNEEMQRGLEVLLDRQLLRRAGEDHVRIIW